MPRMQLISVVWSLAIILATMMPNPAWSSDRERSERLVERPERLPEWVLPGPPLRGFDAITPPVFCAGPLQVQGVEAFVCEFPFNWVFEEADLAQFAVSQIGVTIQAVGGRGGDGGSSLGGTTGGGSGGQSGLAQTTIRGDALAGKSLYIYVANNGGFGAESDGGDGGAATVVAAAALSPEPSSLDDILAAAGGGGGGQGFAGSTPPCVADPAEALTNNVQYVTCAGGDGGVAITIDEQTRIGFARLGAMPPAVNLSDFPVMTDVFNVGAGQPARFDAGAWIAGAGGSGGTAGSAAFSFAGAPAAGSPMTGTWVRETPTLTLGTAKVLGGDGVGTGGAGGGGVAGGGGAGNAGGAGGASYVVGSGYGIDDADSFPVPCEAEGFCARNWLSPATTNQPTVVITFWEVGAGSPVIPTENEVIDTDQPSLVYQGTDASNGIYYFLEDTNSDVINYFSQTNPSATGNSLWTVPSGTLSLGQTYDWFITDQAGKQLQDSQSFTVASDAVTSGLTQGWTLYVRSMDTIDTGLPADQQPLSNQLAPTVDNKCNCECVITLGTEFSTILGPADVSSEFSSCSGVVKSDDCDCTFTATGDKPTASSFWTWTPSSGTGCTSASGTCYANAQVTTGTIDVDWASLANPLGLQVPSRLINITSEPPSPTEGTPVPSLALPAIDGFSGSCASDLIEVTFTARTNGGVRFFIYADPTTGAATSMPTAAIDYWNIPS